MPHGHLVFYLSGWVWCKHCSGFNRNAVNSDSSTALDKSYCPGPRATPDIPNMLTVFFRTFEFKLWLLSLASFSLLMNCCYINTPSLLSTEIPSSPKLSERIVVTHFYYHGTLESNFLSAPSCLQKWLRLDTLSHESFNQEILPVWWDGTSKGTNCECSVHQLHYFSDTDVFYRPFN